jgi:hypothetical protein
MIFLKHKPKHQMCLIIFDMLSLKNKVIILMLSQCVYPLAQHGSGFSPIDFGGFPATRGLLAEKTLSEAPVSMEVWGRSDRRLREAGPWERAGQSCRWMGQMVKSLDAV